MKRGEYFALLEFNTDNRYVEDIELAIIQNTYENGNMSVIFVIKNLIFFKQCDFIYFIFYISKK